MEQYAGIDVSLELSSVCIVDAQGKIVKEAKVASEPEALVGFFETLGFAVKRIGLEAGPLSQWLHAGLKRAGFGAGSAGGFCPWSELGNARSSLLRGAGEGTQLGFRRAPFCGTWR